MSCYQQQQRFSSPSHPPTTRKSGRTKVVASSSVNDDASRNFLRRGRETPTTTITKTNWITKRTTVTVVSSNKCSISANASSTSDDNNNDKCDSKSNEYNGGIGRSITKRIQLAADSHVRLALPGNATGEVDRRPISDAVYGFLFAFTTLLVLGIIDGMINFNFQQPFFIGAWGTISVLALL